MLGERLARRLPAALVVPLSDLVGTLWFFGSSKVRRRLVAENQRRIRGGNLSSWRTLGAVMAAYRSYSRYFIEMLMLGGGSERELLASAEVMNGAYFFDTRATYGGALVVSAHVGNWDFGAHWFAVRFERLAAVAERLEPPPMAEWFRSRRDELGVDVIFLGDQTAMEVSRHLRAGYVVALVSDRDLEGDGVELEFFGHRTTMPAGPVVLALRNRVPLVPCAIYMMPHGGHQIYFGAPIEVESFGGGTLRERIVEGTTLVARALEDLVRKAPEQWHVFVPFWLDQRPSDS
jgi:KDO2-lipid IV(A) lauroyltransferase